MADTPPNVLAATKDAFDWDQGVMLLSTIFQSLLLGMVFIEASQYWLNFNRDSLQKKIYVALVCVATLLQTCIENAKAWWVLVQGEVVTDIPVYTPALVVNGVIISLCQAFFIRRCWKLTRGNRWVLYPLSLSLFLTTSAILYYSANVEIGLELIRAARATGNEISPWVLAFAVPPLLVLIVSTQRGQFHPALKYGYNISINFWIWGTLVIDTVVAVITTVQLSRKKIGLPASDSAVQTFVYVVWETAVLPQLCMITAGGLFHAETHNKRYNLIVMFVTIAGKIYVYMVLWTLNRRDALRKRFTALGQETLQKFRWERGCTVSLEAVPPCNSKRKMNMDSDNTERDTPMSGADLITAALNDQEQGLSRS